MDGKGLMKMLRQIQINWMDCIPAPDEVLWSKFHGNRGLNDAMNKIHGRALRLVYSNTSSTYDELLAKDKSFKIHHRNLQKLAVEILR